jgi:hypothetical protein
MAIKTGQSNKQLSLEKLYVNRTVGRSASPEEQKRQISLKRQQSKNIYAALKKGPLTTNQLRSYAAQYNTRIKELRDWLRNSGMTIDCIPQKGGNNIYKLCPFAGSRYQAELMRKQKE